MSNNSNRAILMVVVALAIILVLLLANAGSCSRTGGMGGGSAAPAATAATSASTSASASSTAQSQQSASATAGASSAAASTVTASASASASSIQEITVDDAIAAVQASTAQAGSSMRAATATATASEVYSALSARGFSTIDLTTDFDASGNYIGVTSLDASSTEAYPTYVGLYDSSNNIRWAVYVNDGKYYASPLTSNNNAFSHEVLLAESDVVTEYDSGMFSDYSLQDIEALGVKAVKVAAIDRVTLDSYTAAQIESM